MSQLNDIAIDVGTSTVIIYIKGHGIRLREPAVAAIDRTTGQIMAFGSEAARMIGRTPANVQVIKPLNQGEVVNLELTADMLKYFITNVTGKHFLARPRAVMSLPTGIREMERKSLVSMMFDAGLRRTQLLDKTIAAAVGAGLSIDTPYGTMIADMSAGSTDIAVLCNNEAAIRSTLRIGGDHFDDAVSRYIRRKYNLMIGERTAEQVKITLGSAVRRETNLEMEITGRNLISGMPKTQCVDANEIYESIQDVINELIEGLQAVIERTPPQLTSDIFDSGITLSGGAACIYGLSDVIVQYLNIPCHVAQDARDCVIMGLARVLEEPAAMRHLLI